MQTGVLQKIEVREYAAAYRESVPGSAGEPSSGPRPLQPRFASSLKRPFRMVVAGSAGGKVRSAVKLVAEAAILSNLWAAQRDDYPITVQTGHSLSDLILSPRPIRYTGVTRPDAVAVLTEDGLRKAAKHLRTLARDQRVFALAAVAEAVRAMVPPDVAVTILDPQQIEAKTKRSGLALMALVAAVRQLDLVGAEALEAAAARGPGSFAAENQQAVAAGLVLADVGGDRPVEA